MIKNNNSDQGWDLVIKPKYDWFDLRLSAIWQYRDLLILFVKRDFISIYKQTILGPLWFFLQPVLTTLVFTLVFGKIAKIPTDGLPPVLFYMAGVVAWNYFADCLTNTSAVFLKNSNLFGKVYFPRLIVPLSIVLTSLLKFGVQFLLFLLVLLFYWYSGTDINPNRFVVFTPILLLIMAGIGLGFGMIISSLTAKYRDLQFLVSFGVQLMMYITPVVYPLSFLSEKYKWLILINPMTSVIEFFKYAYLGEGVVNFFHLVYSFCFMLVIVFAGLLVFQKIEKNFMDTV